ncbi:MAG TPA: flagellar hook-basal body complex protein FliE [Paucimonas sp.]|nr:flagellar hook-basal body complex protein FliE [Paucimonas sp.]
MMFPESIGAAAGIAGSDPISPGAMSAGPAAASTAPATSFGQWFSAELSSVNDKLVSAERGMQKLAVGAPHNLHEVMIQLEEARMSMQFLVQVRNQVMSAYKEVMSMAV